MGGDDAAALVENALRRHGLLQFVRERGTVDRGDIQSQLGVSRSTTHRVVHEFTDLDLLERVDRGYRLTALGHVIADETERCVDTVDTARDIEALIECAEASTCPLDVAAFRNARVTRPESRNPAKVEERILEVASGASSVRLALDIVHADRYVRSLFDALEEPVTGTVVATIDAAEAVVYAGGGIDAERAAAERLEIRLAETVPLHLAIFDDHVCVGVYNADRTQIRLLADSADRETLAWAEDCFDVLTERSEPDPLASLQRE